MKTLREIIGELVGESSMLWSETPTGVFDSTRGSELVKRTLSEIKSIGQVVFSNSTDHRYWTDPNDPSTQHAPFESDLKGLLINIEPIEKCEHPINKIYHDSMEGWQCECGVKVKPVSFEEV